MRQILNFGVRKLTERISGLIQAGQQDGSIPAHIDAEKWHKPCINCGWEQLYWQDWPEISSPLSRFGNYPTTITADKGIANAKYYSSPFW